MIGDFTFEHGDRTFSCTTERRTAPPGGNWWWFSVSRDDQRYSSFEAAPGDTQASVKARVTAYYQHVLEIRARPPEPRHGRPPGRPKAIPAQQD